MGDHKFVLEHWYKRVVVTQHAHYLSADHFSRKKYLLGVPAVVLGTVVGTSVFATIAKEPSVRFQVLLGLASVLAAVLTSLQTFLGYSDRAEKHRLAGAKYGALGRELEEVMCRSLEEMDRHSKSLRERLDSLAVDSPDNPQSIYKKAGASALKHRPEN